MCGIFGFTGKSGYSQAAIKILGLYNEQRGGDATGFYTPETGIVKKAVNSYNFFSEIQLPKKTTLLIGHTRYGTTGNVRIDKNAHPFQKGKVIGVHNGHISNYRMLQSQYKIRAEVDSEVLFDLISKKGFSAIREVAGTIAMVFTMGGDLYFYRNFNPLFYGYLDGGLYWSSIKPSLVAIGCQDIRELEPDYVHSYKEDTFNKVTHMQAKQSWYLPKPKNKNLPAYYSDHNIWV